ncbi:MAG: hypothetical protein HYU67_14145 [Flavobacteriia bacterium]|nr:hypothetical protein [Flavobacteriia bacterium]
MENNLFLLAFVIIPFLGFVFSLFPKNKNELLISRIGLLSASLHFIVLTIFIFYWIYKKYPHINVEEFVIYYNKDYRFYVDFFLDKITIVFLVVGSLLNFLIIRFSRYYMHLENGYKRFFNTILLFSLGYNWTVISGNFEILFIGWEILGISSFLLIAFYRERYLPVRNAVKVFSIYRIGDLGILSTMWASHHLWNENISFNKLENNILVHEQLMQNSVVGLFIGVSLVIASSAKSALVPFSSWLPRAMEGPTPSSAIFYGSLSVHLGLFLLMRTYPFWHEQEIIRILIAVCGFVTAVISFFITKVQSSIKPQVAYASITQIGIIFIELSLGWIDLALIHFVGNAFLRTYQLLISPSIVNYKIQDQFYHFSPKFDSSPKKWKNTLYVLSLKEWYLDFFMSKIVFKTFKNFGKTLKFIHLRNVFYFFIPLFFVGLLLYIFEKENFGIWNSIFSHFYAFIGLLLVLKSFTERNNAKLAWILIFLNHYFIALSVSFNENFEFFETFIYLFGITISSVFGLYLLQILKKKQGKVLHLNEYSGFILISRKNAFLFFLCTLGISTFPITSSFIGEDLLFSHIHQNQYLLALFVALSFIFSGIAAIRIYSRLYLGTYINLTKSKPIKSS